MLILKIAYENGPAWLTGVDEVLDLGSFVVPEGKDADEMVTSIIGVLDDHDLRAEEGVHGWRSLGKITGERYASVIRVRTGDQFSNLVVPTSYTFLMNDRGDTIDRI